MQQFQQNSSVSFQSMESQQGLFSEWGSYAPLLKMDEILSPEGDVRAHWKFLVDAMQKLGPEEVWRRQQVIEDWLRQDGASYNIYDGQKTENHPWKLDPLPVLFSSQEWTVIEQGLSQRAELLNRVFVDLYSERRIIRHGLVPPDIIFRHPAFLRPCQHTLPQNHKALMIYSADLIRGMDGALRVMGDRTQNPSGLGYALENRLTLMKVMPSLFRDSHVHRLVHFFRSMTQSLRRLVPGEELPLIIVLTPGKESETYYEHEFLANYMGYTLVQAEDLVIQRQVVYFRSMEGLRKVDVILRRVDEDYCDPLELRGDSLLGIPGLLQVVRAGNVKVVNPLGSGILESPILMAFLPALSEYFLGEKLLLPSVKTLWCGNSSHLEAVMDQMENYVIKPIHPSVSTEIVFGKTLIPEELEKLRKKILGNPELFVAEEYIGLSTVPVVHEHHIEPCRVGFRGFVFAHQDEYQVLSGGLARVAPHPDALVISNQYGGRNKDIWVLASEPEETVETFKIPRSALQFRVEKSVSGRIAENYFWLGRYVQRTENLLRILRQIMQMAQPEAEEQGYLRLLMRMLTHFTANYPGYAGISSDWIENPLPMLEKNMLDPRHFSSLAFNIEQINRNSQNLHDQMSEELRGYVNQLSDVIPDDAPGDFQKMVQTLSMNLCAIRGALHDSIDDSMAWMFWDSGRRLEWSINVVIMMWSVAINPEALPRDVWKSMLSLTDSWTMFRNRFSIIPDFQSLQEILLTDVSSPHSVTTQVMIMKEHLEKIKRDSQRYTTEDEEELLHELLARLKVANFNFVSPEQDQISPRSSFGRFMLEVNTLLRNLSDTIQTDFILPKELPRQI
ncbi:MAG: circularly permuted type 2 ATP-grasp protein [SAR324 cluster bacterium]|nr:circularly permuted type 2 ATP-grasp protein [SAR324 cluster bacterium]